MYKYSYLLAYLLIGHIGDSPNQLLFMPLLTVEGREDRVVLLALSLFVFHPSCNSYFV